MEIISVHTIVYIQISKKMYDWFLKKEKITQFIQHWNLDIICDFEELQERLDDNKDNDHYLYVKRLLKKAKNEWGKDISLIRMWYW